MADSLRRRGPRRERKARILIYCEGERTEPEYFTKLRKYLRAIPVEVAACEIKGIGQDPLKIVKLAAQRRDEDHRKNGAEEFDQVWCVVDRDQHASLPAAIKRAGELGIAVVLSTPCFEFWLLLHFTDFHRTSTGRQRLVELRKHIRGYDKQVLDSFPFARFEEAVKRAKWVEFDVDATASNPSTNVWQVVEAIRDSGSRRTAK